MARLRIIGGLSGLFALFGLAVATLEPTGADIPAPKLVQVCPVANAGFLVRDPGGDFSMLLDAVVGDGLKGYERPTGAENRLIEAGLPPYDGVDVVFASHSHGDHFNAGAMIRHMEANPDSFYIMTPEALAEIEAIGLPPGARARIHARMPGSGPETIRAAGREFTLFTVPHGSDIQNLGLYVRLHDRAIFHPGDMSLTAGELEATGILRFPVDLALMPYWLFLDDDSVEMIRAMNVAMWLPMHLPLGEAGWMDAYGGLEAIYDRIGNALPNTVMAAREKICVTLAADLEAPGEDPS